VAHVEHGAAAAHGEHAGAETTGANSADWTIVVGANAAVTGRNVVVATGRASGAKLVICGVTAGAKAAV
jgi:hypothetical protein